MTYSCYFAADIYTISRGSRKHSVVSATPHRSGASPLAPDPYWSWKQFPLSEDHFISTYMHYVFIYALYIYIYTYIHGPRRFVGFPWLRTVGFSRIHAACWAVLSKTHSSEEKGMRWVLATTGEALQIGELKQDAETGIIQLLRRTGKMQNKEANNTQK